MRTLFAIIGVLLIIISIHGIWRVYSEPIATLSISGEVVDVLPAGTPLSVIGLGPSEGIKLRFSNGSVKVIRGVGEVPVKIDGEEIRFLFDSEGRFLALSTESGVAVSSAEVSEEFSKAVLTYTVAPFVAGLMFTTASLLISRRARRR